MTVSDIPALNATLNGLATVLITVGFICIKTGRKDAHRKVMMTAMVVSALFLVGYLSHKFLKGLAAGPGEALHTQFGGTGFIAKVYIVMLFTHVVLAISIAYLVPRTFLYAIRGDIENHKRWAKFTFPIWYYVSVTGVLVYFFLYQWWPAAR
jgi:putative membrane protein